MKNILYFAAICTLMVCLISSCKMAIQFPEIWEALHEDSNSRDSAKTVVVFVISTILSLIFLLLSHEKSASLRNSCMGFAGLLFCLPMILLFYHLLNFDVFFSRGTGFSNEMQQFGDFLQFSLLFAAQIAIVIAMLYYHPSKDEYQITLLFIGSAIFAATFTAISLYVLLSESVALVSGTIASLAYSAISAFILGVIGYVHRSLSK